MATLDLIELADLVHPERLVDAIVRQNPTLPLPVPVEELANLAGISRIESFASEGFAGALITNAEKSSGAIFYSSRDPRPRQRFTIGHELGHFLLPWHRRSQFNCKQQDLSFGVKTDWEIEANRFSAELLMPKSIVMKILRAQSSPDMSHVINLASKFETSVEMTARRYIELNEHPCAIIFSKDNIVRYSVRSEFLELPLCSRKGDALPRLSNSREPKGESESWHEIDAHWWLRKGRNNDEPVSVYEQTLRQENGYKITLLTLD
jgi:Zn-dependent peptidase ImmA (M78 family)